MRARYVENQNADVIFRQKKFSEKCWTHDLEVLVGLAGLRAALDVDTAANQQLNVNWSLVAQWEEISRYHSQPEAEARKLFEAVTNPQDGVLTWIKVHW